MSYPENPETIVVQNEFYSKGLREIDVWNHYQTVKQRLLKEVMNRNVMFGIATDLNSVVLRRKGAGQDYIRLTHENYDTLITGRTLTVYSEMNPYERFGIVDIDVDPYDGWKWARKVAHDTYEYLVDKVPFISTVKIRYTGKTSFHIVCDFGRKNKIDSIRFLLDRTLRKSPLIKVYTVEAKRRPGVPNLDLSPNKIRGAYITLGSLSTIGLKCMEVDYNNILSFNPRSARV
jgi:hypothetical protein